MGTHPIFESDFDCLTDLRMVVTIPTEDELKELANIPVPEKPSVQEERDLEAAERQEEVAAHLETLEPEERAKLEEHAQKNGKKLTPALIRKRRKKLEDVEERKKRRLERLERKQKHLEEIKSTLEANLDEDTEKSKIKELENKRKKRKEKAEEVAGSSTTEGVTESEPTGRDWTLSIALPGSILDNAQSFELRTYLAGQIARACVVFNVDEIVIFDESGDAAKDTSGEFSGVKKKGNPNQTLGRILQYLECPQYLRKDLFPVHKDLKNAGLLNPLDTPHHLRANEFSKYREGIVQDRPSGKKKGKGSWINCGIEHDVRVEKEAPAFSRVTVKLDDEQREDGRFLTGKLVTAAQVREESGTYWGYQVRLADSLGQVFMHSPWEGNYDLIIGTSERGSNIKKMPPQKAKHYMVVFGGVKGLEHSFEQDPELKENGIESVVDLFDMWLNTCPNQGSRTIRTEEAILVTLSALSPKLG